MKTCFKCGQGKPLRDFYRHPMMKDGRLGKCKECTKRDVRAHRRDQSDKVCAYDRARSRDPERLAATYRRVEKIRKRNPEKSRARLQTQRAIAAGKLMRQPCEVCGDAKSVAHHDDYSKPLDVRWLCQLHHMRHHHAKI